MTTDADHQEDQSDPTEAPDYDEDVSFVEQGKRGPGGRPPKLLPTPETLRELRGLGRLHATQREGAACFEVSEPTFNKFLADHAAAKGAFYNGRGQGKISLRRRQWKMAETNPTMAIWLGKQHLDQRDKHEHSGPGGGPVTFRNLEHLTDEELAQLELLATKLGGSDDSTPGGDQG